MRKSWPVLLAFLLLAVPLTVQAQSGSGDGYDYSINADGTFIIITNYTGDGGAVTIPTNINGLTVISIGESAFDGATLTGVAIPDSVTSIGDWAFADTSLTGVAIPSSVTNIGEWAFIDCVNLTAITVDTNNLFYSSADGVLFDKRQATLVEYPGGKYGSYAIPDGVTNIGPTAFAEGNYGGWNLTSVTIPGSVMNIEGYSFLACSHLTSVYFLGNAPTADSTAFAGIGGIGYDNATVYYLPGATGWSNTFGGLPTVTGLFPVITSEPQNQLVVSGDSVTFTVAAGGTPPLSYQWETLNKGPIAGATNTSISANTAGPYMVVVANPFGSVTSSVAELSTEVTNTPGASIGITISSPTTSGRTSTGVTGKASATKVPIWNVLYWLTTINNGETVTSGQAVLTGTAWSVTNFLPGTNIISVQAINLAGEGSDVVTREFFYEKPAPLNLLAQGTGSGGVSVQSFVAWEKPSVNALNIGEEYQITPKPDAHSLFGGWTVTTTNGSISTNRTTINFIMEPTLSITADFETNIYLAASGTYNGLYMANNDLNDVTEETAGLVGGLVIRTNGDYSGKLWFSGTSHPISGAFDAFGNANEVVARSGGDVLLAMNMDASTNPPQVFGTVSGTNDGAAWTAELVADRAANNLPAAHYTMLIPPGTNAAPVNSPGGYGYALISRSAGGATVLNTATISGALADGTSFSEGVPLSEDGYVPFYDTLYGGQGLLLGWINLEITNTAGVGLIWIHPKTTSGRYQGGFTNVVPASQVQISPWSNPPTDLSSLTNLVIADTIADSTALLQCQVRFSYTYTLGEVTGPGFVSGSINPATGFLKVSFDLGSTRVNGFGAILQNSSRGGGYFLTPTNGEAIELSP